MGGWDGGCEGNHYLMHLLSLLAKEAREGGGEVNGHIYASNWKRYFRMGPLNALRTGYFPLQDGHN